ncbi:hypothetical protein [Streptomyces sp. NPDC015131]|uniref:hypothetical protein n=1 Tax=Streptomyces sp. NPDC015131 TaxID=3364941 RepID=UPI0036F7A955
MVAMRGALLVMSVALATAVCAGGTGTAAVPEAAPAAGAPVPAALVAPPKVAVPAALAAPAVAPEADVSHHGHLSLVDGRLGVVLLSENRGPSALGDSTVRLTLSAPLATGHEMPERCVVGGEREVLCSTGPLAADGTRHETALTLRTTGAPQELTARIATAWNGGATDRNPADNDHRVLVLATGDPYVF